ncbi:MAG: electron transport complex subunit RsxA [Methanobacteriota archaeon]
MSLLAILISAIFVNNFILQKALGICPFLGVSRKTSTALGMGVAVIFVMTMASTASSLLSIYFLRPLGLEYLKTIVFILVIASLVQFVETIILKKSRALYNALGIYLPLITTNCAILGVVLINFSKSYGFIESVVHGFGAGVGFTLALLLMSGIRERLELSDVPESLEGLPVAFITAGILALSFLGFSGMIKV